MQTFKEFLLGKSCAGEKDIPTLLNWVSSFRTSADKGESEFHQGTG